MTYFARAFELSQRPVRDSSDLRRILALPRRTLAEPPPGWEDRWRRPAGTCPDVSCPYALPLKSHQRTTLYEASLLRGVVGPQGVGQGKAWTSLLLPAVLGAKRPVVLVPSPLVIQTERIYEHLCLHWRLPPTAILGYGRLSHPKHALALEDLDPDCLVADEAHKLENPGAACHKRVKACLRRRPHCAFCALTGTPNDKSIKDDAYVQLWALRAGAPVPQDWQQREHWAIALDYLPEPLENCPPGALVAFGTPVREAYGQWVAETPGVVASEGLSCDAPLHLDVRPLAIPPPVVRALDDLRATWTRPDGEEFSEALDFSRYARQLATGLYTRWNPAPPADWLDARRDWKREVRTFLASRSKPGIDSEALYEEAVAAGRVPSTSYGPWRAVEDSFRPRKETVWLDDYLARDAARWARGPGSPGIVWTRSPALGRRIAELAGVRYYGEGPKDALAILPRALGGEIDGSVSIVASLDAHGTGRNLQMYRRQLFTSPSSNARTTEQWLGRLHRFGQEAPSVEATFYLHTPEAQDAFRQAVGAARWLQEYRRQPQRLCAAVYSDALRAILGPRGFDFGRKVSYVRNTVASDGLDQKSQ